MRAFLLPTMLTASALLAPAGFLRAQDASFSKSANSVSIPLDRAEGSPDGSPPSGSVTSLTPEAKPRPAQSPSPAPKVAPAPLSGKTAVTVRKSSSAAVIPAKSPKQHPPQTDDPGDDYAKASSVSDPIRPVNRGVFWFNHQLYHYVFNPLNKTYKFLFPQPVRTGLANVVDNSEYPVRLVNDLLQWKPKRAGLETEKFLYNTTVGIGGIFRPSDKVPTLADLPVTDTSATFAKWGIPPGCYVVWPVLGPKSLRDTVGFAGDVALNPAFWLTYGIVGGLAGPVTLAVSAPETTSETSAKMDTYETVTKTSVDRYLSVQSAYMQNRKKIESR